MQQLPGWRLDCYDTHDLRGLLQGTGRAIPSGENAHHYILVQASQEKGTAKGRHSK